MNITKLKKIIAREWLIFLVAIFIGIIFSVLTYFMDSPESLAYRKEIYDRLNFSKLLKAVPHKNKIPELRKEYPQYNELSDIDFAFKIAEKKSAPFIEYSEFSKGFNDDLSRKNIYDSISTRADYGDYNTFEKKVAKPTLYSGLLKLFEHLFSRWYWLSTLFSLLIPYSIIQLIRSVYYSVVILYRKGKTN